MILLALPVRRFCLTDPEADSALPPATPASDNVIAGVPVASIDAVMYAPGSQHHLFPENGPNVIMRCNKPEMEGTVAGPSQPREDSNRRK